MESERKGKGERTPKREWEEWDQTDEYTSVPILSMGCGETAKNRITRPEDDARGVANSDEAVESTCITTTAGNLKFVCDKKFEAIAEQSRDEKTKQGRTKARFDCDGGAPTSCGGCGEERGDAQVGNEEVRRHRRTQEGPEPRGDAAKQFS